MKLTPAVIRKTLQEKMIDPELGMNVVDLGLVYDIKINQSLSRDPSNDLPGARHQEPVTIVMTLTTPGCPLAAVFGPMVRQALSGIPGLDPYKDVEIELTFDPPWHAGMMSERAKAEIGFG